MSTKSTTSKPCELNLYSERTERENPDDFVRTNRKDQNHNPKSDSERDSIECWRNGEVFDGSIGSNTSKGTQRRTVLLDTRTRSFKTKTSVSRKKRIAQILERGQSLPQYYNVIQIARLLFYKAMIPHSTAR